MPRTYKPAPKKTYTDVAVENALLNQLEPLQRNTEFQILHYNED